MPLNPSDAAVNKAAPDEYFVGWHGHEIAKLSFNGVNWSFDYSQGWVLPLTHASDQNPGELPYFLLNLMPEVKHGRNTEPISVHEVLHQSERFLSNIMITRERARLDNQPIDRLDGRLDDHSVDHVFQGACHHQLPTVDDSLIHTLDSLQSSGRIARLSGCQAKLPCHLDGQGNLRLADKEDGQNNAFTHILKLPGLQNDPNQLRGAIEWMSMSLAQAGGVETAGFSLVELPHNVLAYVTERFDIPTSDKDTRQLYCEDFCSAHSVLPFMKGMSTVENLIDVIKRCSTREDDKEQLFRLIYANKLLENGDFHFKNAALLSEIAPSNDRVLSTVLTPAFDIMNTRYFSLRPRAPEFCEKMTLDFQGTNDYTQKHMLAMGKMLGMGPSTTQDVMYDTAERIATKAFELAHNLPDVFERHPTAQAFVVHACQRAVAFCKQDFPDIHPEVRHKSPQP